MLNQNLAAFFRLTCKINFGQDGHLKAILLDSAFWAFLVASVFWATKLSGNKSWSSQLSKLRKWPNISRVVGENKKK
jgi:hypothetical protein